LSVVLKLIKVIKINSKKRLHFGERIYSHLQAKIIMPIQLGPKGKATVIIWATDVTGTGNMHDATLTGAPTLAMASPTGPN
jgi:hypothetical protein